MCNRHRMSAKQAEVAICFGIDPALTMPETDRLPPPELFPTRDGWVVRKQDKAPMPDITTWGFPPPPQSRAPVEESRREAERSGSFPNAYVCVHGT
jgi:putative SOS response-associated peptidase YedK